LIELCANVLGHKLSTSTAYRLLSSERRVYDGGGGERQKIDLLQLLSGIKLPRAEPGGRPSAFSGAAMTRLAAELSPLTSQPGFGPMTVQTFAGLLYTELRKPALQLQAAADVAAGAAGLNIAAGDNAAAEAADVFVPSQTWCYWFLHTRMELTPRRITSEKIDDAKKVIIERIHRANCARIAVLRAGGMPRWAFVSSDEKSELLFPRGDMTWAKKGARHVESAVKDSYQQITGDIGEKNRRCECVHIRAFIFCV